MAKIEKYRIISGNLMAKDVEIPFTFGLVFEDNGVYTVDFHIPEKFSLKDYNEKPWEYRQNLNANCLTDEKDNLEIKGLYFESIYFTYSKITLICRDCLIHRSRPKHSLPEENSVIKNPDPIYFLELEGMALEFCDHSEITESRYFGNGEASRKIERNYTSSEINTEFSLYRQYFYKSSLNDSIIVDFTDVVNHRLTYEKFLELKKDYVTFLSFLNGATVKIRAEFTGEYHTIGRENLNSEIVVTYSYPKIINTRYNNYIPLNKRLTNVPDNILGKSFMFSFDKFREWNKKLDLSSVIYYLNTVEKINSAEERFFIQIIAFERLTARYAENAGYENEFIPTNEEFKQIKKDFYDLLEKHKTSFGNNYSMAKSTLGNLNRNNKLSTKGKMYAILNDLNITIDDEISELIDEIRNKAVHEGQIGDGHKGVSNMYLLNELIHEIILRLINYKSIRYNWHVLDENQYKYV